MRLLPWLWAAWWALFLTCVPRYSAAAPIDADPLRRVTSLATSWSITTDDLTPLGATNADLSRWNTVPVPGTWSGTSSEGAPVAWYGIDVHAPPREGSYGGAALALPPFLYAYDVFAGGLSLGASGVTGPRLEWGPFRHSVFQIPAAAWTSEGVLRVRLRVASWSGAVRGGTNSVADAQAVAIGPADEIAGLVELSQARARLGRPLGGGAHYVMLGIALVFLALFALAPALKEYAYFAAYLILSSSAATLSDTATLGDAHPLSAVLPSAALACLSGVAALLMLRRLLDLHGRAFHAVIALQLVFLAVISFVWCVPLAMQHGHWYAIYLPLHAVTTLGYMLVALSGSARRNLHDARVMISGFSAALAIVLLNNAYGLLLPHAARSATTVPTGWLGFLATLVWSSTMTLVLARRYRRSIDDLTNAFAASTRFVPSAFLRLLGRENVTLVQRGDRTHRDMAVLFCDIRGFTPLAERLGAEPTIVFLNRYLLAIEPAIVDQGGFINQYYGDGIMALFERADDAVLASQAMMHAVDAFNVDEATRSGEQVRIGIGLHAGMLALGTIGGLVRLDAGVVGDAVNTAARVEGMTKMYGARVLLTGAVRERLTDPSHEGLREIDRVLAVGKRAALTLLELISADPPPVLEGKRATQADFDRGLERIRASDLDGAHTSFAACLARVPTDGCALVWKTRCEAWRRDGLPSGWDGVIALDSK